jgi:hypothetical protein
MDNTQDWYDVIDDFLAVPFGERTVLIPREDAGSDLHINVLAAVAAKKLRLESVDEVRRHYIDEEIVKELPQPFEGDLLREAYDKGLAYVTEAMHRLDPEKDATVTLGEYAASIALERLTVSFKSVHILYLMGHRVDGDAVARVIVEQCAWALEAATKDSVTQIDRIKPQSVLGRLKELYPKAGRFHGILTKSTHLDLRGHKSLFEVRNNRGVITLREDVLDHGCLVLLHLADLWAATYEATQAPHQTTLVAIVDDGDGYALDEDRSFLATIRDHMTKVKAFLEQREREGSE